MANSIVTMNQFVYKKLPYDLVRDFQTATLIAAVPYVLLANKDFCTLQCASMHISARNSNGYAGISPAPRSRTSA